MVDHDVGEAAHDDVGAACGIIHGVRRRDDVVQLLQARTQHLHDNLSLGAEGNTGDTLALAEGVGAELANLDQAWWFPAVAPAAEGQAPAVMLAERSLPGSLIVDQTGKRFNLIAAAGVDEDFQRGHSAYDHYYGDPTQTPNPNLRPLSGTLYAVKMVVSSPWLMVVYGYIIAKHAAEAR